MTPFQLVFGPLFLVSLLVSLLRTSRGRMAWRAGLLWALLWGAAALVVLDPELANRIGWAFGIGRGADFVLYLGLVAGLYAALALYERYRRLEAMVVELLREKAINQARLGPVAPAVEATGAEDKP